MSVVLPVDGVAPRILVVDDERMIRWSLRSALEDAGGVVDEAATLAEARTFLEKEAPDLVLLDMRLPDGHGLDLLQELHREEGGPPVVVITAFGSVEGAVDAMRKGAFDYVSKPFHVDDLLHTVGRCLQNAQLRLRADARSHGVLHRPSLIAEDPVSLEFLDLMRRVAESKASTVLLLGETGVGKGLAARMVHDMTDAHGEMPFVQVPCTAIPEALLESEMFGHEKGAFTDAKSAKRGLVELAMGGTLFLDEIGDLPSGTQAKLLTLLEEREFRRVGGTRTHRMQARVVAATNRNLSDEVEAGRFRADLYYRLKVVPIEIPALRKRAGDILPLANRFLEEFRSQAGRPVAMSQEVEEALLAYRWPGNVRELRNAMERAALLCSEGRIERGDLPPEIEGNGHPARAEEAALSLPAEGVVLDAVERAWVREALERTGGNRTQAAKLLGLNRDQIRYRIEKFGLG